MHTLTTYPVQFDEERIPIEPRNPAMPDALCAHFKQGYGQFRLEAVRMCCIYHASYLYHTPGLSAFSPMMANRLMGLHLRMSQPRGHHLASFLGSWAMAFNIHFGVMALASTSMSHRLD